MRIEVSDGELLDKLSILEIKLDKIQNSSKLHNVRSEETSLRPYAQILLDNADVQRLYTSLLSVNKKLWDIEDAIREKERNRQFDDEFVQLARSVYFTNDERADIKKAINLLTNSTLIEEKSYESYT